MHLTVTRKLMTRVAEQVRAPSGLRSGEFVSYTGSAHESAVPALLYPLLHSLSQLRRPEAASEKLHADLRSGDQKNCRVHFSDVKSKNLSSTISQADTVTISKAETS